MSDVVRDSIDSNKTRTKTDDLVDQYEGSDSGSTTTSYFESVDAYVKRNKKKLKSD